MGKLIVAHHGGLSPETDTGKRENWAFAFGLRDAGIVVNSFYFARQEASGKFTSWVSKELDPSGASNFKKIPVAELVDPSGEPLIAGGVEPLEEAAEEYVDSVILPSARPKDQISMVVASPGVAGSIMGHMAVNLAAFPDASMVPAGPGQLARGYVFNL